MRIIKRRILIENFINRESPTIIPSENILAINGDECAAEELSKTTNEIIIDNPDYGRVDVQNIYLKIFIPQKYDDMGIFTDHDYEPNENAVLGVPDPCVRLTGLTKESYYVDGIPFTGLTDSKSNLVESYSLSNPFIVGLNRSSDLDNCFTGVIEDDIEKTIYVVNGEVDASRNYVPDTGVIYTTYKNITRTITLSTGGSQIIPLTEFTTNGSGKNESNTSLSAITKEEKYFGVVFPEQIVNDVFIDRGNTTVFERHLRFSEIDSVDQLERYNNGFFNIIQ